MFDFNEVQVTELIGTRVVADQKPALIVCGQEGAFRINEALAKKMNIDYAQVLTEKKADRGVQVNILNLGNGKFGLVLVYPPHDKGSKLANPAKGLGGSLQFSSKAAWIRMEAKEDIDRTYTIEDEQVVSLDAPNVPDSFNLYGKGQGGVMVVLGAFSEAPAEKREVSEETKAAAKAKRKATQEKKKALRGETAPLSEEELDDEFAEDEKVAPVETNNASNIEFDNDEF